VRRYEALFILDTAGSSDDPTKLIESVKKYITKAGGKVEAEQKLDKRPFARVADKKHTAGYYVNLIFNCDPKALPAMEEAFAESAVVFRVQITRACASATSSESEGALTA